MYKKLFDEIIFRWNNAVSESPSIEYAIESEEIITDTIIRIRITYNKNIMFQEVFHSMNTLKSKEETLEQVYSRMITNICLSGIDRKIRRWKSGMLSIENGQLKLNFNIKEL